MSCISDVTKQSNNLSSFVQLLSFSFLVSHYQFRKRKVMMKTRGHWFSENDLSQLLSPVHLAPE